MNWSPPRLIGTPLFRAIASGFAPAANAAGFRPVVAGQYLRETADVNALELVFLEPAARTRAASNWSITITPQLIWQHLSGAEPKGAKSSATTNTTEVTPSTHTSRESSHSSNTRETRLVGQSDRLSWLQEFARWVSSQREVNERRHDGVTHASGHGHGHAVASGLCDANGANQQIGCVPTGIPHVSSGCGSLVAPRVVGGHS